MSRHDGADSDGTLGQRIASARKAAGLTQPQLARKISDATAGRVDLQASEISRYERGGVKNPRLEVLAAFADVLELPLTRFTGAPDRGDRDRLAALEETVGRILQLNEDSFLEIARRFDRLERRLDGLAAPAGRRRRGAM
jgi:transcriptional regulator with XRE-family HTH domain